MDSWSPPIFDILSEPEELETFSLGPEDGNDINFARSVKISPDGSGFIAQCEDHSLKLFDFPDSNPPSGSAAGQMRYPINPRLTLAQPSPVVDYAWFPSASRQDPATYCFVSSVRECPVKLLDANTGKLRASYRIVDHRERQIAPHSLAFTYSGERLFCGFEDAIEVFDVARPGEGERRHTSPSKKSKDGLKGIISALAFAPTQSTSDDALFAAGSLTPTPGNIALFSEAGGEAVMALGGGPSAGVTQLQFNHYRPHILYATYRGSANGLIYGWDLRSRIDVPLVVYDARPKNASVGGDSRNQKVRFALDIGGRYVASGNFGGEVAIFDVEKKEAELEAKIALEDDAYMEDSEDLVDYVRPSLRFEAHNDVVAAVAFQPWRAELLTISGSRHFDHGDDEEDSSDNEDSDEVTGETETNMTTRTTTKGPKVLDSSMKLWNFAPRPPPGPQPAQEPSEHEPVKSHDAQDAPGTLSPHQERSISAGPTAPLMWELDLD